MGETAPADLGTKTVEDLFADYDRLALQRHQAERFVRDAHRKQQAIRDEIAIRTRRNPQWEVSIEMNDTVAGAKLETEQAGEPSA